MIRPLALALLAAWPANATAQDSAPPSREMLHELCRHPRLAGTPTSRRATDMVARTLREAGWEVTLDEREVLLSLPRRQSLQVFPEAGAEMPALSRLWTYDPDAIPAGDVPPFNAWTASGLVNGPLLDVGYGMREDFERLKKERIAIKGSIALARYGKGYRGVKVAMAEEYGCVGILLFSDPSDDGALKGKTWPNGPWKPGWEAQRGSIGSFGRTPGDPSTPGFPSPEVGRPVMDGKARLSDLALAQALPKIPCMPIGASDAQALLSNLARHRMPDPNGGVRSEAIGPGPAVARLEIDAPREYRTIVNVIARLQGRSGTAVMAGNHRDAWVRGAADAGGGTVALLRAAQILGAKVKEGWVPQHTLFLGFWDAEESGLIGSVEWVEKHGGVLARALHLYINADVAVSGLRFRASGTPGLESYLAETLAEMTLPPGFSGTRPAWPSKQGTLEPFALPGSGSDFAPFLHHLAIPVIDMGYTGNSGGHYHTAYDDIGMVERFLDPNYEGHELAAYTLAAMLEKASDRGRSVLDEVRAAQEMARQAVEAKSWMGDSHGQAIANAFRDLATVIEETRRLRSPNAALPPPFYQSLLREEGLPGDRAWYRHILWSPDQATGYGSETFPVMRICVQANAQGALDFEVGRLVQEIDNLKSAWKLVPRRKP